MSRPGPPLVVAHRGDSARAPENTLAAFRAARRAGTDWIELDIQYTADGHVICLHDFTLARTAVPARPEAAAALALAEIRRLDAGSRFGPAFAGERVPTLAEAVAEARSGGAPAGLLVEIKDAPRYGARVGPMLEDAARVLREAGLPDPARPFGGVVLQSFHPEPLEMLARAAPEFARFQLLPPFGAFIPSRFPDLDAALDAAAAYAAGIGLPDEEAAPAVVEAVRARGMRVFVWTVNDRARIRALAALGVDGIITDDPASAREALETRGPAAGSAGAGRPEEEETA